MVDYRIAGSAFVSPLGLWSTDPIKIRRDGELHLHVRMLNVSGSGPTTVPATFGLFLEFSADGVHWEGAIEPATSVGAFLSVSAWTGEFSRWFSYSGLPGVYARFGIRETNDHVAHDLSLFITAVS